ncbi:fimbrial protein [Proteus faecis]|uniref:fimbrial protein n=1 Tax=Proteus faecis TaxID=2050967 RepID=UPI0020BDB179
MKIQSAICLLLLIVSGSFSGGVLAKNPFIDTPIKQSDYESNHSGQMNVKASVFNAPCNLSIEDGIILTKCGIGYMFQQVNILNVTAKTPAIIIFYDVGNQRILSNNMTYLDNGNNYVHMPLQLSNQNIFRLEVSYE